MKTRAGRHHSANWNLKDWTQTLTGKLNFRLKSTKNYRKDIITEAENTKPTRKDCFGNVISLGQPEKKHKIVFADHEQVKERDRNLVDVYYVESFKSYNTDMSRPNNQSCCSIF